MNVRQGFAPLYHTLTGEPEHRPTDRELTLRAIASAKAAHRPVRYLQVRLREITHAELRETA